MSLLLWPELGGEAWPAEAGHGAQLPLRSGLCLRLGREQLQACPMVLTLSWEAPIWERPLASFG